MLKIFGGLFILIFAMMLISCGGSGGGDATANASGGGPEEDVAPVGSIIEGTNVAFDLTDAIAIVAPVSAALNQSSIMKITKKLDYKNVINGDPLASYSDIYIDNDNNLYVSPISDRESYTSDGTACSLVMIQKEGSGKCVDVSNRQISDIYYAKTDDFGNIYYEALESVITGAQANTSNKILKKISKSSSKSGDVSTDGYKISAYLVMDNGIVYLAEYDQSYDYLLEYRRNTFLKKISPDGVVEIILDKAGVDFIKEFPDGNIYIGAERGICVPVENEDYCVVDKENSVSLGVLKITSKGFDDKYLIGDSKYDTRIDNFAFDISSNIYEVCSKDNIDYYSAFCYSTGTVISYTYRTSYDRIIVIAGNRGQDPYDFRTLWEYYPEVHPIITSVYRPYMVKEMGSALLIAGKNIDGKNVLVKYDPVFKTEESDLLGEEDVEIIKFKYYKDPGVVLFEGKKQTNNTYLIGYIDTRSNNAITIIDKGPNTIDERKYLEFFNP